MSSLNRINNFFSFLAVAAAICWPFATHAQPTEKVPFITSDNVTLEMQSSAGVKRGDHVTDLDSGDGCMP